MKTRSTGSGGAGGSTRAGEAAAVPPIVLLGMILLVALLVALAVGAVWFLSLNKTPAVPVVVEPPPTRVSSQTLSEATRRVLGRLDAPVELRFYSVLTPTRGTEEVRSFAGRVTDLLAAYERAGAGRINVSRMDSPSSPSARSAAMADGIQPLHLDGGEMSFLGIAVSCRGERAVLPRLAPEWEAALEFDLSRVIERVAAGKAAGEAVSNPAPGSAAAAEELLLAMPEVESLSAEDALQEIRDRGLEEFEAAVGEMQVQVREAQRRLAEAQNEGADAVLIARKNLQALQVEQNEQLGEISRRMQARIGALEQIKKPDR